MRIKAIVGALGLAFALCAQAQYATPQQSPPTTRQQSAQLAADTDYYINSDGEKVRRPKRTHNNAVPPGATAQCRDGSYSFSTHRRGTCSHHSGVAKWL